MWGGRFSGGPSHIMQAINACVDIDQRLAEQDIDGSIAHARMLADCGVISAPDCASIITGLETIRADIRAGRFVFSAALEDVHMNIEANLKERIGEPAGRLHTARSRNDQVATDFRLWCRAQLVDACAGLTAYQRALVARAEEHAATLMPGFTHLQTAQPVTLGHHLLAYVEMAERDIGRLEDASRRLNESPLGAAALAGTSYPINRHQTAEALGFSCPMRNSLDAVASRDFALETLSALTIATLHLTRFADEIVLWTSAQFGFATLSDAFSTGSSIMPQKRNPDAAELVRAKLGTMLGGFNALTVTLKALPLAYSKDMQEDKAPVMRAFDDYFLCLAAMTGMTSDLSFNMARMEEAAAHGHSTATEIADWLVQTHGVPFREAHHITGRVVAAADLAKVPLWQLPLTTLQSVDARLGEGVRARLSPRAAAEAKTSFGGTAPDNVLKQVDFWNETLSSRP
jgi:argininosuccinate lyase